MLKFLKRLFFPVKYFERKMLNAIDIFTKSITNLEKINTDIDNQSKKYQQTLTQVQYKHDIIQSHKETNTNIIKKINNILN